MKAIFIVVLCFVGSIQQVQAVDLVKESLNLLPIRGVDLLVTDIQNKIFNAALVSGIDLGLAAEFTSCR